MIRHVALFRWKDGTSTEHVDAITRSLRALTGVIPELRAYAVGSDLGWVEGNVDFAAVADVDDHAGWLAYRDHPEHRRVIDELIAPVTEQRTALQYEVL